jgi:ABC-type polysaccharide/polyol phosphate export permease
MLAHFNAIWKFRHFWMSLVKMDLMTRYRKSVLGIGWSLLQPVMMTAILTVVFSQFVRDPSNPNNWQSYSILTITAMTVYGFLRDNALHGCHCLARNESYIRQTPLPFSIY